LLFLHIGKITDFEQKRLTQYGLRVDWLTQLTELPQDHLHRLQHGPHLCGEYCDATYLGLILTFDKENSLPIHGTKEEINYVYGPLGVFKTLSVWKEKLRGIYCGEKSRAIWKPDHVYPARDKRYTYCVVRVSVLGKDGMAYMSTMDAYLRSISRMKLQELGM
jgi:hypothetical protein